MRDKDLSLYQFHIQLEKQVRKVLFTFGDKLLRTAVPDSPKCLRTSEDYLVVYPRDFSSLRALAIVLWNLPEDLKWRILLDLEEKDFRNFNRKQRLELKILLNSKEICYFYLFETKRYSARELFGNILGNELKQVLLRLVLKEKAARRPKRVQRHRGYRDKGSLRPRHRWLETSDFSLTETQLERYKNTDHFNRMTQKLLEILREDLSNLESRGHND